jgi:hypothetical protein
MYAGASAADSKKSKIFILQLLNPAGGSASYKEHTHHNKE